MNRIPALLISILLAQTVSAQKDTPPDAALSVRLYASAESVAPGAEIDIAVELEAPKPWHVYHPIVLDTGFATELKFSGPPEATVENLRWPTPSLGAVTEIEYLELKGKFTVLATLKVSSAAKPGTSIALRVDASALACIEACVPVEAKASLSIPIAAAEGKPANERIFNEARKALTQKLTAAAYLKGSKISISKEKLGLNEAAEIVATLKVQSGHHIQDRDPGVAGLIPTRFLIEKRDGIEIAKPKDQTWPAAKTRDMPGIGKVREQAGEFQVKIPIKITDDKFPSGPVELRVLLHYQCCTDAGQCYPPEFAEAMIRFVADTPTPDDGKRAFYAATSGTQSGGSDSSAAPTEPSGQLTLLTALLFGFLGGLILNIMPCVLPVISIKIMSFVQQGGEDPRRVFRLGVAFCAGILVWFWLFALLSRTGDLPLQYPSVVTGIAAVLVVMALNLFGVFEITLPGAAAGKLDSASQREGYSGAFLKGFLATILGTACTAPMLAPALIFAAAQPDLVAFLVFTAAGLGMAAPYLLLCANPKWLRFLPRPGLWMVTFKQSMGFILLATVVWLLYVLNTQIGGDGVVWTVSFFGFLGLGAWIIGKIRPTWTAGAHWRTWAAALAISVFGYWFSLRYMHQPEQHGAVAVGEDSGDPTKPASYSDETIAQIVKHVADKGWEKSIPWIEYRPYLAETLASRGYTVYVDFTASWCVNCKWNLNTVLETESIRGQMAKLGVIPIEGDFSNRDPAMLRVIQSFGRPSVPLNVIYPANRPGEPIVLDVLLSESHVTSGLARAGASVAATPDTVSAAQP